MKLHPKIILVMNNRDATQPSFIAQFASGKPQKKYLIFYILKKFNSTNLRRDKKKQLTKKQKERNNLTQRRFVISTNVN